MRTAFVRELETIMKNDRNAFLLTGDLGYSVFEKIKDQFPEQYINMGVSEQNMVGVSAGMALTGKNVFVYSIIPFIAFRPFEQVRNDICYQNLAVRLVGVGAGFSYSDAGFTHHAIDDYGVLMSLPNLTILSPSDPLEVIAHMKQLEQIKGPLYLRLGRNGDPVLHDKHNSLRIGKALEVSHGDDILFVTTGSILGKAMSIAKLLESEGYTVKILDYHTIKPFDNESLLNNINEKMLVVTFEEHLTKTGIFSIVAQLLVEHGITTKIISFGITDSVIHASGSKEYMLNQFGLNIQSMFERVKNALEK